jgi:predicted transcriptional regulator
VGLQLSQLLQLIVGGSGTVFGALETRVLEALWRQHGAANVRGILHEFPGAAYTTLMTTLDRLYRKGVLERKKSGRAYVYHPRYTREELDGRLAAEAMRVFFGREPGSVGPALSFLLDAAGRADPGLLDELETLVRERRARDAGKKP